MDDILIRTVCFSYIEKAICMQVVAECKSFRYLSWPTEYYQNQLIISRQFH